MKRGRPGNATVGLMTLGFLGFVATWPFIISKRHVRGFLPCNRLSSARCVPSCGHWRHLPRGLPARGAGGRVDPPSTVTHPLRPQSSITSSSKEKLPGNLTMRGQYLNTGSNDIGTWARGAAIAPRRSFLTRVPPCALTPVAAGAHPDWDWNTMTLKENQRGAVHIVTTQDEGDGKSGEGRE